MTLWLDHQLSPHLTEWLEEHFDVHAAHVRERDLHRSEDAEIFQAARRSGTVVMTKDRDFVELVERHGPPPQVEISDILRP